MLLRAAPLRRRCAPIAIRVASPWRTMGCTFPRRGLSSSDESNGKPAFPPFVDEVLRGAGQVLFLNSPTCGALTLAALGYGDPWLGALAALGTTTATATAHALKLDKDMISAGLAGYNGCLVGCAFSVFLGQPAWTASVALATVGGAAASAPIASALKPLCGSVPQFTLAFNIATLSALVMVKPLAGAAAADPSVVISALEWACSPLVGVSQIFVVNDAIAGAMILGAIGAYSPAAAAHTYLGSCIGVGTALALGAPASEIGMGLWGFNPALTSLAVSVFFVPGAASYSLAAGGAAATAVLFGGAKGLMASSLGVPALTLPFCAVAASAFFVQRAAPNLLVLAAEPHSPEKNAPP